MGRVEILGLERVQRGLRTISTDLAKDLRRGLKEGPAEIVAAHARTTIPVLTGRARDSIRPGSDSRGAFVKGGGGRVPYYGWLEFGGSISKGRVVRPRVAGGRYLYPALDATRPQVEASARSVIDAHIEKAF